MDQEPDRFHPSMILLGNFWMDNDNFSSVRASFLSVIYVKRYEISTEEKNGILGSPYKGKAFAGFAFFITFFSLELIN
ncbi:MAG: hypothetical protein SV375_03725 [Thermodesulfobacteriota bacterium]|nr:hypothetical protein [Thermodesulfobacteriota bacterium]